MLSESIFIRDAEQNLLWNKIQQLEFDTAGTVITFKDKLASQQKWATTFAERVIEEYRKFIFLCCISPAGASPSQTVDEAWHLHLTYTQSYWIDLCKNILGRDLHHYPTKGGEEENRKHQEWYKKTLELYVQTFEAVPPTDIWPVPNDASIASQKPAKLYGILAGIRKNVLVPIIVFFIISVFADFFPFNLDGPQFLTFYALVAIATGVIVHLINERKSYELRSFIQNRVPDDVNVFHIAEFHRGMDGVVQTSILDFVRKGLLSVTENKKFIVNNTNCLPDDQNPYSAALCKEVDGKEIDYKEIKSNWSIGSNYEHPVLMDIQKMLYANSLLKTKLVAVMFVIGIIRIIQGVFNDYPVFLLALEVFAFTVAVLTINEYNSPKNLCPEIERTIISKKTGFSEQQDEVVTDFAINGKWNISGYAEAALLASIFFVSTPAMGADGGGGGGCGSGSGGGCGGCGGCGGGG